jgi:Homeodomain-like domain-containing protein
MRTPEELQELRAQAISLRRAGKPVREIKQLLGPISNRTLATALRGEPPPEWTRRPNAREDLRARARELRLQGLNYDDIVARLHVSKSSVSLWVRDLPRPVSEEEARRRRTEAAREYWLAQQPVRDARRAAERDAACDEIGKLTDREIIIAGAIAYWCEGTKSKPHRRRERVTFMNSDPDLVRFFLCFLQAASVPLEDLVFRVYIHESANVEAARRFWLEVTGAMPDQFRNTTLKRHNPKTVRKNTGEDYHGCLKVDVRRSSHLYRKIEGWATVAMSAAREC